MTPTIEQRADKILRWIEFLTDWKENRESTIQTIAQYVHEAEVAAKKAEQKRCGDIIAKRIQEHRLVDACLAKLTDIAEEIWNDTNT